MAVLLRRSNDIPTEGWHFWAAIGEPRLPTLDLATRLPDLPRQLEAAVDATAAEWRAISCQLGVEPNSRADLAHTPACGPNVSDFGIMLAWTALVDRWAQGSVDVLVICDDPWLFRHLSRRVSIVAGTPPRLWASTVRLWLRGFAARTAFAARAAWAGFRLRSHRDACPRGTAALLSYGHPASRPDGYDGYFGPLMTEIPDLQRVLHVDCPAGRAEALAAAGRTFSLHAWGQFREALGLPFQRWRPNIDRLGPNYWILRRAAALEGGTGQAAAIHWQQHCHARWLTAARPRSVAWPWENHAWERDFIIACRRTKTLTVGFQHTPFGRQDFSFHPGSNAAGAANMPDRIVATGPACLEALEAIGYPRERLTVGGSLRFVEFRPPRFDSSGPVLVALPYHPVVAPQMVRAALDLAACGRSVLVKPHPMAPSSVAAIPRSLRTDAPFADQPPVSAVVFAASSIGLEALAGGIPALRFLPEGIAALDPMPAGVSVPVADSRGLAAGLQSAKVFPLDISMYYAPADIAAWRQLLSA